MIKAFDGLLIQFKGNVDFLNRLDNFGGFAKILFNFELLHLVFVDIVGEELKLLQLFLMYLSVFLILETFEYIQLIVMEKVWKIDPIRHVSGDSINGSIDGILQNHEIVVNRLLKKP